MSRKASSHRKRALLRKKTRRSTHKQRPSLQKGASQKGASQKGGGSTALPDGHDYSVTAKVPSGQLDDPDSIFTQIPKELYFSLKGAKADEVDPPP
jgi:hypothetical protein